jgi:hypothetical protein
MGRPSHRNTENVVTRSDVGFPRTAEGNHTSWWITRVLSPAIRPGAVTTGSIATMLYLLRGGCDSLVAGLSLVAWAARRQRHGKVSAGQPRRVAVDETAYAREQ